MILLMLLLDAGILMTLLKVVNDDDVDLLSAGILAFATSVVTTLLALSLSAALGTAGLALAAVVAAVALGFAVAIFFGVELKRALLIAVLFLVIDIAIRVGLRAMTS